MSFLSEILNDNNSADLKVTVFHLMNKVRRETFFLDMLTKSQLASQELVPAFPLNAIELKVEE